MKQFLVIFFWGVFRILGLAQEEIPGQTIYTSNFNIDSRPRNCTFYIPLNYGKKETYPLLVVLHNKAGSPRTIIKSYGEVLHENADSLNAIVIYPDAVNGNWNSYAAKDSVNDVGYLSILIDYFVQRYQANAGQVYIAGFGQGATLAKRTACDIPAKITSIALFSYTDKLACDTPALLFPDSEITQSNGKVTDSAISNMWKFFLEQKNE